MSRQGTILAADAQAPRAIVCMLVGCALISLNDGLIKVLVANYPVGQLLVIRGLFALPWILLFAWRAGGVSALRIGRPGGQLVRAFCVIIGSFLFINGLIYLPLADAIAVAFTGPLFITALAPAALGEKVGWRRWAAVLVGFAGVLFMVRPGTDAMQFAVLFPLGAALAGAVRDLVTRRISQTETTAGVLLFTTLIVIGAGLCTLPFGWEPLRLSDLGVFAVNGLLIGTGHYLLIEAFRNGEAAMVAPFKYTSLVWAVLFGFLLFGDFPDGWTLFGAAFVICAGLYVLHREMRFTRRPIAAGPRPPAHL